MATRKGEPLVNQRSSSNTKRRWECGSVTRVTCRVDEAEWQSVLETVARELYELNHQLQDNGLTPRGVLDGHQDQSHSLPNQALGPTLTPGVYSPGEDGVSNGKESPRLAA